MRCVTQPESNPVNASNKLTLRFLLQEALAELDKIDTTKDGKADLAEITAYMKAVTHIIAIDSPPALSSYLIVFHASVYTTPTGCTFFSSNIVADRNFTPTRPSLRRTLPQKTSPLRY